MTIISPGLAGEPQSVSSNISKRQSGPGCVKNRNKMTDAVMVNEKSQIMVEQDDKSNINNNNILATIYNLRSYNSGPVK